MRGALRMLPLLAACTAAWGAPSLRAQDAGSANPDIPDMRAQMLAEYHFVPDPAAPAAPAAKTTASALPAPDKGVIQLPTVYVSEKKTHDAELTAAFQDEKAAAHTAAMMKKLGVGVVGFSAGKHFAAGVVTVFYIPVFVGGGWSW